VTAIAEPPANASGDFMKIALVHSVRTGGEAFGWKWRSEDGAVVSAGTFRYFNDCCENARRKGYACTFDGVSVGSATPAALQVRRASQLRA
jgi:hypothetical protein